MPDAEEYRKYSQHHCYIKGGIVAKARTTLFPDTLAVQNVKAGGYGLQLKGNIRHDTHNRYHGHEATYQRAFSVTERDEVGYARDMVSFAQADYLAQDQPPDGCREGGAQVNGQKSNARGGRAAYAAVESPPGTINRDRKRVYVWVADNGPSGIRALVAVVRDGE